MKLSTTAVELLGGKVVLIFVVSMVATILLSPTLVSKAVKPVRALSRGSGITQKSLEGENIDFPLPCFSKTGIEYIAEVSVLVGS